MKATMTIWFYKDKTIRKTDLGQAAEIDMQELKAIYKKCEEMNWL